MMVPRGLLQQATKYGSTYDLVLAVARRAERIAHGADPAIRTASRNPLTIALEEAAAGVLPVDPVSEDDDTG